MLFLGDIQAVPLLFKNPPVFENVCQLSSTGGGLVWKSHDYSWAILKEYKIHNILLYIITPCPWTVLTVSPSVESLVNMPFILPCGLLNPSRRIYVLKMNTFICGIAIIDFLPHTHAHTRKKKIIYSGCACLPIPWYIFQVNTSMSFSETNVPVRRQAAIQNKII